MFSAAGIKLSHDALAAMQGQSTSKIPPMYDGQSSWFDYEDAVTDWTMYTEIEDTKRAMALKNRLAGYAKELSVMFSNCLLYTSPSPRD